MSRFTPSRLGLAALALAALARPLGAAAPFTAHMAAHVLVVAVAAPLLAFALSGTRLDPTLRAPTLFAPITASLVEFVAVWTWHAPSLHHAARHDTLTTVAEHVTFLVTSLALWLASVGAGRDERRGLGVVALLLTSMHMTLLGALIALSPRALYAPCSGARALSALDDEHLGGAVMIVVAGASYLAGAVALTAAMLRGEMREAAGPR